VAHLASQQFVSFFSLLALSDIQKDAEHNSLGNVGIVPLAPRGNPADIAYGKDTKINWVQCG
jgi:hypothetical protein